MNNNCKRILSLILAGMVTVMGCVTSFAAADTVASPEVALNAETNVVTVSGVHPLGEGIRVTVNAKVDGSAYYMREISAGKGGAFTLSYTMDPGTLETAGDQSGQYIVTIGGAGLAGIPVEYTFVNVKDGADAVRDISGAATWEDAKAQISAYASVLNLDLEDGSDFDSLSADGKQAVYTSVADVQSFASAMKIISFFETAVGIQSLNEAKAETADELLNKYKTHLNVNMGEASNYAGIKSADSLTRLYGAMAGQGFDLDKPAKVSEAFERAVYTELINELNTSTRDKLITYIQAVNTAEYAEISLDDYNSSKLSATDRVEIINEVLDKAASTPFKDLTEVETTFEKIASDKVKSVNNPTTTTGKRPSKDPGRTVVVSNNSQPPVTQTPAAPQSSGAFTDLGDTPWAVEAINSLAAKGVVNGVGDGRFMPNGEVKREEFVKMMMIALNIPSEDTQKRFNDVAEGSWYYDYIQDAYALNIVTGIDFDVFGVGQNISREQMCTMLYRAMQFMDINISDNEKVMSFEDNSYIAPYAYDAVEALYRAGVVNGVSDTHFNPQGTATRAMAAQMIYQLMKRGTAQ